MLSISGWLATVIGRKRFYMICVALFTVASLLCGFAWSLESLVLFRILQGLGGGGMATSRAVDPRRLLPAGEARPGLRALRRRRRRGAGDRADARRLDHRHLFLALGVPDQRADGPALAVAGRHAGQRALGRGGGAQGAAAARACASTMSASRWSRSGSARSNSCSTRASATTGSART